MRSRGRFILIPVLAIFFVIGMAFSASALVETDYDDTWHKLTSVKFKGVCEDADLSKESTKVKGWLYIVAWDPVALLFDAELVTENEDGTWQANSIQLEVIAGDADDAVLQLVDPEDIIDDLDIITIESLQIRLTGKEDGDNNLKSSKIKDVSGVATLFVDGVDCWGALTVKGKFTKTDKVPDDVVAALPVP